MSCANNADSKLQKWLVLIEWLFIGSLMAFPRVGTMLQLGQQQFNTKRRFLSTGNSLDRLQSTIEGLCDSDSNSTVVWTAACRFLLIHLLQIKDCHLQIIDSFALPHSRLIRCLIHNNTSHSRCLVLQCLTQRCHREWPAMPLWPPGQRSAIREILVVLSPSIRKVIEILNKIIWLVIP